MSTIVLRSVKGTPLTNTEVDSNFSNLNTDKIEIGGTYSSGTASGVLFLNSSKVLTTGSALTFDGTNFGVGGTAPYYLTVNAPDNNGALIKSGNDSHTGFLYFGDTASNTVGAVSYDHSNNSMRFQTNGSEQMRLTSSLLLVVPGATIQGLTVGRGAGAVSTNTAVGASALAAGTTADYTTAIGHEAALSTTTATRVTAVGSQALRSNTTGRNTAFGWAALYTNTTGNYNTALGDAVLYSATTADGNTGVGYGALLFTTTGASNVAVGQAALRSNTTASNNTAVGYQAMYSTQTGGSHAALGYQALYSITQNVAASVAFGFQAGQATTTGSVTALGTVSLYSNTTGASNVAAGNSALYASTTGSNNVAVGDASLRFSTTASGNTAVGFQSAYSNTTGADNVSLGKRAGYSNQTGGGVTAVGADALYNNTASNNTAVGVGSLFANTTGTFNLAVGAALYGGANGTLGANTTGSYNTALGVRALQANTTASGNTAVGYGVLYSNTTGASNVAMGQDALTSNTTASRNTAVGYQAGYSDTTGYANLFAGYNAGRLLTTGTGNTFVGDSAGGVATTGNFNTFVGQASGSEITTGAKNTIIGIYNGNQGGLDIRTSSNYIVLSDGDGNARGVFDNAGTFYVRRDANGVHLQTQVSGTNAAALGSFNGAPTVGSNLSGYSGIMFNGASIEPTLDALNVRQDAVVDIGSTNYRFKLGCFTGINFPATQVASANANTLDDYEEGTWTPVLGSSGTLTGQTYSRQEGRYTKVGRLVTCTFDVILSDRGTLTGEARILGLPFTCVSGFGFRSAFNCAEFGPLNSSYVQFGGLVVDNTSQIYIRALTTAAASNIIPNATDAWSNTTQVIGTVTYMTA